MSDFDLRSSMKNLILNIRKAKVHNMNTRHSFIIAPMFGLILFSLLSVTRLEAAEDSGRSGATLYKEYCLVCHGDKGDGNGFAAKFLDPRPRDFRSGVYKIRSTPSLPTDEDIIRTITKGIPGTLMPAFEFEKDLKKVEIMNLVAYVKSFSDAFEGEIPEPISFPKPPPKTEELLAMGEKLYVEGGCGACHGQSGKGDGPSAENLQDKWGYPIPPYDFTIPGRMKGGSTVSDIYRAFYVGIGGTPMPAYGEIFTEEQNWALAYYTLSLADSDEEEDWDDWGDDESPETFEGDSITGRDLIMGVTRFKNGGPPCMGCHSVMGEKVIESGGGPWGPDLSIALLKFKEYGFSEFLKDIPYPTMKPLYDSRKLTEEEQGHVLAFLTATTPADGNEIVTASMSPLYIITILIGLLGIILFTLTGLIAGKKNMEVRQ